MEKSGLASRWKQVLSPTLKIMNREQRLSLIQMILLRYLKAGFGKKGGLTAVVILIVTARVQ